MRQLNAMSLDIPGEDGEGPAIYDLQTDFPWMYEPNAPAADLLERVLKVRDLRELAMGQCGALHSCLIRPVSRGALRAGGPGIANALCVLRFALVALVD